MKRTLILAVLAVMTSFQPVHAADLSGMSAVEQEKIRLIVRQVIREYAATLNDKQGNETAKALLKNVVQDNQQFMRTHKAEHFGHFLSSQHPRATVVTCSDSRVHTHALDASPDGDLFMIRNIGNQVATAEGSLEYGVHHLHTPVVLIIGHVACGAIKAASGDYSAESAPIRRELDTIQIPKGDSGLASIKINVNNQVRYVMGKYENEVLNGSLTVVGAIYDFKNEMGMGQGKLNLINVNGETDLTRLAKMELLQGLDAPPPAPAKPARPGRRPLPAAHGAPPAAPAEHAPPAAEGGHGGGH